MVLCNLGRTEKRASESEGSEEFFHTCALGTHFLRSEPENAKDEWDEEVEIEWMDGGGLLWREFQMYFTFVHFIYERFFSLIARAFHFNRWCLLFMPQQTGQMDAACLLAWLADWLDGKRRKEMEGKRKSESERNKKRRKEIFSFRKKNVISWRALVPYHRFSSQVSLSISQPFRIFSSFLHQLTHLLSLLSPLLPYPTEWETPEKKKKVSLFP